MITLVDVLQFLRPNAQWTLVGDSYEGLTWYDEIQIKPTVDEISNGYVQLAAKIEMDNLLQNKLSEIAAEYSKSQYMIISTNNFQFEVSVVGDYFNTIVANQVLQAQVLGSAPLLVTDMNGEQQIILNVDVSVWISFFKQAKEISFNNFVTYQNKLNELNNAQTKDELSAIQVDVFPPVGTISFNI